ncbi:peptide-methionine (S)-S-oxide reductase [Paraglaciecola sp.]|uniref:peptide-methionine (S)-S-oxide reductase n=1 Tax=Paraglaciecola sp. TaxID=1920173 RepID=UPI003267D946
MTTKQHIEHTHSIEDIYFAGGCLWGVQEYLKHLPGVVSTEAGRANGASNTTKSDYDGFAECVKVSFATKLVTVIELIDYFFEIIDPYSIDQQGQDVGRKYRTGIYSKHTKHLEIAKQYISKRDDAHKIAIEVVPLNNYVKSDDEHQERLTRFPNDYCHIPKKTLHKYKQN